MTVELIERLASIETRVYALERQAAVDEVHRANVETRLGSIEDTLKWLVRLVVGGMLMAALGYMMAGGMAGV